MIPEKLEEKLLSAGLPLTVAKKMSLKLLTISKKVEYKKDKWGEIKKKHTKKRKLSMKAKAAKKKMKKTLKFRKIK